MNNEYNNPNLIVCMFLALFPFGIDVPKMNNRPMKMSLQMHHETFDEFGWKLLSIFKTSFIFIFNI